MAQPGSQCADYAMAEGAPLTVFTSMTHPFQGTEPSDAVDFSVLDQLRVLQDEGEQDFVAEVVRLFLEDSPRRVRAIQVAASRREAGQLGVSAHGLKGSAANVGAVRLRALCEGIERLAKTGKVEECVPLIAALSAEYPRVQAALAPLVRGATSR